MLGMKFTGVSKEIYSLYLELERLENKLTFSVFYSFAESLGSHHFMPGFDFENYYYEIQTDGDNNMQVLKFYGRVNEGVVLSKKEVLELVGEVKKIK